jgi:hypothetical protein
MPNWCNNLLKIKGSDNQIDELLTKAKHTYDDKETNEFSFESLIPPPSKDYDIDWTRLHWGTKWDTDEASIINRDKSEVSIIFNTAWNPPLQAIKTIWEMYPKLEMELIYFEMGMVFGGRYIPEDNTDEYVEGVDALGFGSYFGYDNLEGDEESSKEEEE